MTKDPYEKPDLTMNLLRESLNALDQLPNPEAPHDWQERDKMRELLGELIAAYPWRESNEARNHRNLFCFNLENQWRIDLIKTLSSWLDIRDIHPIGLTDIAKTILAASQDLVRQFETSFNPNT